MSSARSEVMAHIRQSLGRGELDSEARDRLTQRLRAPEATIRPAFEDEPVERFTQKLQAVAGTVARVGAASEIPAAVEQYLDGHGLEPELVVAEHPFFESLDWPDNWITHRRPAQGEDRVSLTCAFAAVAETGTVVMFSAAHSPTTLNFLPDDHIVVLQRKHVVSHFEDVWWLLRKQEIPMPRTVNLITGPSRTADVEQTIQLGAHGPRRFHVILVDAD